MSLFLRVLFIFSLWVSAIVAEAQRVVPNYFISKADFNFQSGPPVPLVYFTVTGKVITELGTALHGTTLFLSGGTTDSFIVSYNGVFRFDLIAGDDYEISPGYAGDSAINGISTLDLLHIRRHILFIHTLETPYKVIAADVDGSNAVTTLDFLLTRSVVLQVSSSFPGNRVWTFVNSSQTFADVLNPFPYETYRRFQKLSQNQTRQDFIAVKLGDVNNSWDPNTPKAPPVDEVGFVIHSVSSEQVEVISVPVKVENFKGITGFQFTISWDAGMLTLNESRNRSLDCFFGNGRVQEGLLTTSWTSESTDPITLADGTDAFELIFSVNMLRDTFSEVKINSSLIPAEAYDANLDGVNVIPVNGEIRVGNTVAANVLNEFEIFPNPVTGSSEMIISLEKGERVLVHYFDISGKTAGSFESDMKAGRHELKWPETLENGTVLKNGIYFICVKAGDNTETLKAVLAR